MWDSKRLLAKMLFLASKFSLHPWSAYGALLLTARLQLYRPEFLTEAGIIHLSELFPVIHAMAVKQMHDTPIGNNRWASAGKLSLKRFNELEVFFMKCME
jgi:hypothetical protein